jgi:hypothetical protein
VLDAAAESPLKQFDQEVNDQQEGNQFSAVIERIKKEAPHYCSPFRSEVFIRKLKLRVRWRSIPFKLLTKFLRGCQQQEEYPACCREDEGLPFGGNYFKPVAIRIGNEIYAHSLIFIADAAHLLMSAVGRVKIINDKGEMQIIIAMVVCFLPIPQPGELNLVVVRLIGEIHQLEFTVRLFMGADLAQPERCLIKGHASGKIQDINICMRQSEFHRSSLDQVQ